MGHNQLRETFVRLIQQNVRGIYKDEDMEECALMLTKQKAWAATLQETWKLQDDSLEHGQWLFLTHGPPKKLCKRGSLGVAIVLSRQAQKAYKEAGSRVLYFGLRIIATRLHIKQKRGKTIKIFLVSAYAPDSAKSQQEKDEYNTNLQACIDQCKSDEVLVIGTDANASPGIRCRHDDPQAEDRDKVLGPFGNPHQNKAGQQLHSFLGINSLCLPTTFFRKKDYCTWYNPRNKLGHQIDHFIMKRTNLKHVRDAGKIGMGMNTDHYPVVMKFQLVKKRKVKKTPIKKADAAPVDVKLTMKVNDDGFIKVEFDVAEKKAVSIDVKLAFEVQEDGFIKLDIDIIPLHSGKTRVDRTLLRNPDTTDMFNRAVIREMEKPKGINTSLEHLHSALKAAEKDTLTTSDRRQPGWFEAAKDAVLPAISARNEAQNRFDKASAQNKDSEKARLKIARKASKRAVAIATKSWYDKMIQNIAGMGSGTTPVHPAQCWEAINALRNGKSITKSQPQMSFKNEAGELSASPKENANIMKTYLGGVFNKKSIFDQDAIDKVRQRSKEKWAWFDNAPTDEEIGIAVAKLGTGKSGADKKIPAEYYKAMQQHDETKKYLPSLISEFWKSGSWKHTKLPEEPEAEQPEAKRSRKSTQKAEQFNEAKTAKQTSDRFKRAQQNDWPISFVKTNPRRPGSQVFNRFAQYSKCKTIPEALANGALPADLKTDYEKGYLTIQNPDSEVPAEPEVKILDADKDGVQFAEWLVARLKLLPKKGDLHLPSNWRGICLLDIASKVVSSVLVARMSLIQHEEGLESQCGFTGQRGTTDGNFNTNISLQKRKEHNLPTWCLFIDLVKAFDTVSREALFQILAKFGMPDHFINIVIRLHTDAVIRLKIGDEDVEVPSTIGVRQGSCEGPVLFLFIMQACIETAEWPVDKPMFCTTEMGPITGAMSNRKRHVTEFEFFCSLFADDCGLLFGSREDLIVGANYIFNHLKRFGLQMHIGRGTTPSKTEAVYFPKPRDSYEDGDTSNFNVADGFVSFTKEFKYLGAIIHYSLTSDADVIKRISSASSAFGAMRECFFSNRDIDYKDKGTVYVALCLSILLYGSESWCLTEKLYNKLRTFHHQCVRAMCRINIRHTIKYHIKTSFLLKKLGIQSFDFYYNTRLLRWAGHVARMPMQRLPRMFLTGWVNNTRPVGGVQMNFGRTLKKALKSANLPIEFEKWHCIAQDRNMWRSRISKQKPVPKNKHS